MTRSSEAKIQGIWRGRHHQIIPVDGSTRKTAGFPLPEPLLVDWRDKTLAFGPPALELASYSHTGRWLSLWRWRLKSSFVRKFRVCNSVPTLTLSIIFVVLQITMTNICYGLPPCLFCPNHLTSNIQNLIGQKLLSPQLTYHSVSWPFCLKIGLKCCVFPWSWCRPLQVAKRRTDQMRTSCTLKSIFKTEPKGHFQKHHESVKTGNHVFKPTAWRLFRPIHFHLYCVFHNQNCL